MACLLCVLLCLPGKAAATTPSAAPGDSLTVVFRFVPGKDMFFSPYRDNKREFERLALFVGQHRAEIADGSLPLYVDGYCHSADTEKRRLALARIRSNRVKSELITREGLTEDCFRTHNHATEGDFVTVRIFLPRPAREPEVCSPKDTLGHGLHGTSRTELVNDSAYPLKDSVPSLNDSVYPLNDSIYPCRPCPNGETHRESTDSLPHTPQPVKSEAGCWYAGVQGGVPLGVGTFSSFGTTKRAGISLGIYGGYRFGPLWSVEAQAAWGRVNTSPRSCCSHYWLGTDGHRYEAAVAGMAGWDYAGLKSRSSVQRYGVQLNVNLLALFAPLREGRWTLELSPRLSAVGTKATVRTTADNTEVSGDGTTHWHLGAGGNVQAGCRINPHLHIDLYTGLTWLTGQPLDGMARYRHHTNYIWESGLRLSWRFGKSGKEAGR